MKQLTIALLFGGQSHEHHVSCQSAVGVYHALRVAGHNVLPIGISPTGDWYLWRGSMTAIPPKWYTLPTCQTITLAPHGKLSTGEDTYSPQVAFPVLHGPFCEDGRLQGLLDLWGIPYVGCGVEASVLSMNKVLTKRVAEGIGIPTLPYVALTPHTPKEGILEHLAFPLFVKPARAGSSVGCGMALDPQALETALATAFSVDDTVLVEPFTKGQEVEVAVFEDKDLVVSRVGEILSTSPFYDYETKYGAKCAKTRIPANIPCHLQELARTYAATLFRALGCRHLSRVDFFVTKEGLYLNEINTLPGFTPISMYPSLMEDAGIPLPDLVSRLCRAAL